MRPCLCEHISHMSDTTEQHSYGLSMSSVEKVRVELFGIVETLDLCYTCRMIHTTV